MLNFNQYELLKIYTHSKYTTIRRIIMLIAKSQKYKKTSRDTITNGNHISFIEKSSDAKELQKSKNSPHLPGQII